MRVCFYHAPKTLQSRCFHGFLSSEEAIITHRIIVRTPNWLGDQVMALEFFEALRAQYPQSYIVAIGPERALQVLRLQSGLCDRHWVLGADRNHPMTMWQLAQQIQREEFDIAFGLNHSASTAILFALARVKIRVGFSAYLGHPLWTQPVYWAGPKGPSKRGQYLSLLTEYLGQGPLTPAVAGQATRAYQQKRVVVFPGARIALREWPYQKELLESLVNRGYEVCVAGGPSDLKWSSMIRRWNIPVVDKIGQTDFESLVALCKSAELVIANDTGTAHVAATLAKVPTIVLFGPGNSDYIMPSGPSVFGLKSGVPCQPCESTRCRSAFGFQYCLNSLLPKTVLEKVDTLVNNA